MANCYLSSLDFVKTDGRTREVLGRQFGARPSIPGFGIGKTEDRVGIGQAEGRNRQGFGDSGVRKSKWVDMLGLRQVQGWKH